LSSRAVHRRPASSAEGLAVIFALPSESFCPDCGVLAILAELRGAPAGERIPAPRECPRCKRIFRMAWRNPSRTELGVVCHRMYGPDGGARVDPSRV